MNKLFAEFDKPSYQNWVDQLTKDLKGESDSLIKRMDEVEELNFNSFQHADSAQTSPDKAFNNKYVSQTFKPSNAWDNLVTIVVKNELEANKKALEMLNSGATALRFICEEKMIDWKQLTNEIQLEFIQTSVQINTFSQFKSIFEQLSESQKSNIRFELDVIENKSIKTSEFIPFLKEKQLPIIAINGYNVQQGGATTWQEVAFMLSAANEALAQLIDGGLTIDQAAACIHFNVGAGSTYFYEIAKIRAFRVLWSRIIEEYQPQHTCSFNTIITGIVGFTNKSLKDPYTNLLRQTTEAMSLVFGGVNYICVQPYDTLSTQGASTLATRMAVNIPLILQEESYLDKVIDPLHGSYTVEYLTNQICDKAWNLFQTLEQTEGVSNEETFNKLKEEIAAKANLRKERIASKADTLIGINIFPNPTKEENTWANLEDYAGLPQLIIEQSL